MAVREASELVRTEGAVDGSDLILALADVALGGSADGWIVALDGTEVVTPEGETFNLSRRRAMRLILAKLVEQRRSSPGESLSAVDLMDFGWPGQTLQAEAGFNRVYVTMASLRKQGLKDLLVRDDDGYLLDPAKPLTWR